LEGALARHQLKSKPRRFGKQKRLFDSPSLQLGADLPVAFIFDERGRRMVNRWYAAGPAHLTTVPGVNPMLNRICLKLRE
jgi:hypothetical protein